MGVLSVLKVLHGDSGLVQGWLRMGRSIPLEEFHSALARLMSELVVESYGRILSCQARGNTDDLHCAVLEVVFEMNQALCILNGRWVTHDYMQGLQDAYRFPRLPEGYAELVPLLWNARGFDDVVPLARALVDNFWQLLRDEGVNVPNYQDVRALPLFGE